MLILLTYKFDSTLRLLICTFLRIQQYKSYIKQKMFKNSISRYIPYQFHPTEQEEYVGIEPKIYKNLKSSPMKKPFNNLTNNLQSYTTQNFKNVILSSFKTNQQDQQCNFIGNCSQGKINSIKPRVFKDRMLNRKQEEMQQIEQQLKFTNKQIASIIFKQQKQVKLNIKSVNLINNQQKQYNPTKRLNYIPENQIQLVTKQSIKKIEKYRQNLQKTQFPKPDEFQYDLKQLPQSKFIQSKQVNAQICKPQKQFQTSNIFQSINQKNKNIRLHKFNVKFKFDVQHSSDSEEDKQIIDTEKSQNRSNKLSLNKFVSQESQQNKINIKESKIVQNKQDGLQNVKNINIEKLKINFQISKSDKNFLAFCPIPVQNKICLIVKRDNANSQYLIFDKQLTCPVMKIVKNIGGTYKFFMFKDYITSIQTKQQLKQIAKMKANFIGTQFNCYTYKYNGNKKQKNQCVSIKYDVNILGFNGPRKFKFYVSQNGVVGQENLLTLYQKNPNSTVTGIKSYKNKTPKWLQQLNAYVLNLRGTASHSSIKNCIIVDSQDENKQRLIFGKKSKDIFNLQIKHPFTVLQGAAFAVSSFQKKLGCQ